MLEGFDTQEWCKVGINFKDAVELYLDATNQNEQFNTFLTKLKIFENEQLEKAVHDFCMTHIVREENGHVIVTEKDPITFAE